MVSLEEAKQYLKVDGNEEDDMISSMLESAEKLVQDVSRLEDEAFASSGDAVIRIAVLYALAYLYEHRENANHTNLTITLRGLLFGVRKETF